MRGSIKRTSYVDLPFLSGYSLNSVEKNVWPQTSPFFDILINFKTLTSQSYPAKSVIKGLTERRKSIMRILTAQAAMPCVFERKIWP